MAGLTELTGSLIEMNAHMYVTSTANAFIVLGAFMAAFCGLLCIITLTDKKKDKNFLRDLVITLIMIIIGVVAVIHGTNLPREKHIFVCANGPISIEQISAVYDVVKIDGKMLELKER